MTETSDTERFELINPKIEGADTVKVIKNVGAQTFETNKELTLCDVVVLLDEYDKVVDMVCEDRDRLEKKLKALKEVIPVSSFCEWYYPRCCSECKYFTIYRNFCGESNCTTVTAGCKWLDNEKDYDRDTGDKIAKSIFEDCPFKDFFEM